MSLGHEDINHLLDKAKSVEASDVNEARIWLLVGKSLVANNFKLNYEAYSLEKRRWNAEGAAAAFEPLVRKFLRNIEEETTELANAVLAHHFSKGKESDEQVFLLKIFSSLPKDIQLEILVQKSENAVVLDEKCQCSLLLVKLYPDTVQQHGADLLFSVLSGESDAFSTFRKLLVVELVPAVLQLNSNLGSSPKLLTLLNLCVEYYVLVADTTIPSTTPSTPNSSCAHRSDIVLENVVMRMDKVFKIFDGVGQLLQWRLCPFFGEALDNSSLSGLLALCQNLQLVFQNQRKYDPVEVAYVAAIAFLGCLTTYSELSTVSKFGQVSKLQLVEIFCPKSTSAIHDFSQSKVLTTVSNDSCLGSNQTPLLNCFQSAVKIWQLVHAAAPGKGDRDSIETEFLNILMSMKSLNLHKWTVFQNFLTDYGIYTGANLSAKQIDALAATPSYTPTRLASLYCSAGLYNKAAEQAIKIIQDVGGTATESQKKSETSTENGGAKSSGGSTSNRIPAAGPVVISSVRGEDFSFFNAHIYSLDPQGNFVTQRRVHFISENRSELIYYAVNILIRCFERIIADQMVALANEDHAYGHLMTLLQLEWPSPPTEFLFLDAFDRIQRKGSFSYYPFFEEFILEPDFLEHFASMSYDDSCKVVLDFFGTSSISNKAASSRRMATRGVQKGTKDEFREAMVRQMAKNGLEKLEDVMAKFLTQKKGDILKCFT